MKDEVFDMKKFLKKAAVPVLTALILTAGLLILGRMVTPVGEGEYFRADVEKIAENKETVDILFLGSSRIFRSFVPEVYEEKLGVDNCLVAGSSGQRVEESYLMLKDLNAYVKPQTVVLGVQWNTFQTAEEDVLRMEHTLKLYDRLSLGGKAGYLVRNIGTDVFPQLFYLYRYRFDFTFEKIMQNLSDRRDLKTNGYTPDTTQVNTYHGNGFIYANRNLDDGNIAIDSRWKNRFDKAEIDPTRLGYLDKLCDYCKENGIKLILVSPPVSMMSIYNIDNFQGAIDFYTEYAKEKGIVYHNLNYVRDREEIFPDRLMYDGWHFSGEGAYKLSSVYGEILAKYLNGEDVSGYFYKDIDELKQNVNRVVALRAEGVAEGDEIRLHITSLQNDDADVVYCIEIARDGGKDYELLTDWTDDTDPVIPILKENEKLRIKAALSADDENAAWQVYDIDRLLNGEEGEVVF